MLYKNDGSVEVTKNLEGETLPGHHAGNGTMLELVDFVRCIEEGKESFANVEIAKSSIDLCLAVQQAINEEQVIRL